MKFIKGLLILAATAEVASGSTLVQRDLATVQNVLTTVSQQVDQLDTAVKDFSGDPSPLTSASATLLSTIQSGTTQVSGTSALSETDALSVATYVQTLNTSVANTVNDLIAQKTALVAANAGKTVLQSLQDQKTASQALADAITSKVPKDLQQVAAQLSAGIGDSLQRGIDTFTGTGDAPPGSTTTPSGTSTPSGTTPSLTGPTSGPTTPMLPTGTETIWTPCSTSSTTVSPIWSSYANASTTCSTSAEGSPSAPTPPLSSTLPVGPSVPVIPPPSLPASSALSIPEVAPPSKSPSPETSLSVPGPGSVASESVELPNVGATAASPGVPPAVFTDSAVAKRPEAPVLALLVAAVGLFT